MMATHIPSTEQRLNLAAAIARVADRDAAKHGQRRESYNGASLCACPIAEPFITDAEHGIAHCTNCEEALNVDTIGVPFRRWPGDLTNADATMKRVVASAHEEMLALVRTLPTAEQQRLARIAQRNPARFNSEARKAIDRHAAITAYDAEPNSPRARRSGRPEAERLAGETPHTIVLDDIPPSE